MNRRQKIIVSVTGIFLVLLILVGLTYAYFLTRINGNENTTSIGVTTANLELTYGDGNGVLLPYGVIIPNSEENIKFYKSDTSGNPITTESPVDSKTFTVTNNGNDVVEDYGVILEDLIVSYASDVEVDEDTTTIPAGTVTTLNSPSDFEIKITCTSSVSGNTCDGFDGTLADASNVLLTNDIEVSEVHTYTLTMKYLETGENQSADMNKTISARIDIMDTKDTVDLTGTVANATDGSYVETETTTTIEQTSNDKDVKASYLDEKDSSELKQIDNETETKRSYVDKDGNYSVIGLKPGSYKVKYYNSSSKTTSEVKTINIVKGEEASVSGDTITITDSSRSIDLTIDANTLVGTLDTIIKESGTLLKDAILENGALVEKSELQAVADPDCAFEMGEEWCIENNVTIEALKGTGEKSYDKTNTEKTEITKVSDGTDMSDTGIFTAPDDYGTSYYFRGTVKNNYVDFAGFTWRIVRINGDGSIRLILDGTLDKVNIPGTETKVHSSETAFNTTSDKNAYVGYMYGTPGSDTYKGEHEFTGDKTTYTPGVATPGHSTIKVSLDKFYDDYLKTYNSYIADTLFCGDKTPADASIGSSNTAKGFGTNQTYYAAIERLYYSSGTTSITTATPTLMCANNSNDDYSRYSVKTQTLNSGKTTNGDLTYPIALLSADELVMAGAFDSKPNTVYYLHNADTIGSTHWWTMSPSFFNGADAYEFYSYASNHSLYHGNVYNARGARPVINLRSDILVDSGDGTEGDGAYKVRLP